MYSRDERGTNGILPQRLHKRRAQPSPPLLSWSDEKAFTCSSPPLHLVGFMRTSLMLMSSSDAWKRNSPHLNSSLSRYEHSSAEELILRTVDVFIETHHFLQVESHPFQCPCVFPVLHFFVGNLIFG